MNCLNEKSIVIEKEKKGKIKWTYSFLFDHLEHVRLSFGPFSLEKKSVKFGDHVNLEKCPDWLTLTCTDLFDTVWCFV